MHYERLVVDSLPLLDEVVRFIARRHRLSADEVDELVAAARLKMIENNYDVLRRFQGRSSMRTFLATVIRHHLLDLRNSRWGKWRPSALARRLGPLAIELDGLVTRDGLSVAEAVESLIVKGGGATREELQKVAGQLPRRSRRRFLGAQDLLEVAGEWSEDDVIRDIDGRSAAHRIEQALQAALDRLDPSDRLLLKMRYQSGLQVSRIARLLELPQKALYRRFIAVFGALRDELEARGVKAGDVEVFVGHPATEFAALMSPHHTGKRRGRNFSKRSIENQTSSRSAQSCDEAGAPAESYVESQAAVSI